MDNLKELELKFKNIHLLNREDRIALTRKLELIRPDFLKPYYPKWWWWKRCDVRVLIVTDGGLNFGTGAGGLSEFLTIFNRLQATTWNNYQITLGHRGSSVPSTNSLVVSQINNFNFQTSVTLNTFDQVWLFGINSGSGLSATELPIMENYMNGGGGVFATGDHGSLGSALCGNIPRVKDMRFWTDLPSDITDQNAAMRGAFRNDTNRPSSGSTSMFFDNQSDSIPQVIAPRIFSGGLPHPLLSISPSIRPSAIIDVMPDHPHEGECKPERTFSVNGVAVTSQNIATSFVLSGSTINNGNGGKTPTIAHSFPSIGVWDGRLANVGRIVVDSTWHHFVNINLNGEGSQGSGFSNDDLAGRQTGLNANDYTAIKQYFMNIATWMTRRKPYFCWRRFIWIELLRNSQLIEASLNNPIEKIEKIKLADLASIGSLADEILSSKYSPAFSREFMLDCMENQNQEFSSMLNNWNPKSENDDKSDNYYEPWINFDLMLYTSIGAGFIALRDDKNISSDQISEKDLDRISEVFAKGMSYGLDKSVQNFGLNLKGLTKSTKFKL
ncbi:hypothetical protein [Flavobacterium sp.]|jgi:hypothetical protein|uniref:hypothetical protein n=1 Tax=Flavobacterium sp. TaxID=239 RepID=UPI0037BF63A5